MKISLTDNVEVKETHFTLVWLCGNHPIKIGEEYICSDNSRILLGMECTYLVPEFNRILLGPTLTKCFVQFGKESFIPFAVYVPMLGAVK